MKSTFTAILLLLGCHLSFAQVQSCRDIVFPTLNTSLYQGVYFNELRWEDDHRTVTIGFVNGTPLQQSKVKQYAVEWCQHANLKFVFVDKAAGADIRISFYYGKGSWSLIGKQSSQFSVDVNSGRSVNGQNGPSMNYGWFDQNTSDQEFRRTILHEFGHALGLLHEHLSPLSGIKWNVPKVYAHYMQTQNWSKEEVDKNVLNKYSVTQTNGEYDPASIMHYPVSKEFTLDGYEVGWNYSLSAGDKKTIKSLYPGSDPVVVTEKPSQLYRITGLAYGDSIWALTMSKSNSTNHQAWRTRTYFPKDEIQEYWDKGYYISELSYGQGLWALVMSQGTGYSDQVWRTRSAFPEEEIKKFWDEGYYITNLSYGNGLWALVMSQGSKYSDQIWRTRSTFPKAEIQEMWDQGYHITSLTYGNGLWALVMAKNAGFQLQVWRTRNHFPKDEIQEMWDKGYYITSLTYGNGLWGLVMSKGAGYKLQSWRTRKNFPEAEIGELWKK